MLKVSKSVIITAKVSPNICGVGDYSINLATNFQTLCNLDVNLIVESSCQASSQPVLILPLVENWSKTDLQNLFNQLQQENVRNVILQYTPWLYSPQGCNLSLINFWRQCAQQFNALLIVHETYSWFLKYPGTWGVGLLQQYVLRSLIRSSHDVFSASELYLKRLKRFSNHPDKIHYLPIPSNISPKPQSLAQKQKLRHKLGISPQQIVLTLFGCRGSIYPDWLSILDRRLSELNYSVVWLLLGDAQKLPLSFNNPALRPGYLNQIELSHYLQISDLMLMPHEFGISAKRTSLMSAIQHGLPVVGTDGMLTDSFFRQLPSLFLTEDRNYPDFEEKVLKTLSKLPHLVNAVQISQAYYQKNLNWSVVTQTLLPYLRDCRQC